MWTSPKDSMMDSQRLSRGRPSGQLADDGFEFAQDMAYLRIEGLPFRREVAAAIGPLDKAHAKEFFEFLHLGAEGRLGDIGCFGRSRKVSVLTVNDKVPQLLYRWQFHVIPH